VQFTAVPPRGASGAIHVLLTLCYRETAIRLYDPPTPALRSCPGSCRCVGSPALKNVKSDEQCTAAAPLSPALRTILLRRLNKIYASSGYAQFSLQRDHRDSAERGSGLSGPGKGPPTIRNCVRTGTHRNSRVVHTLLYIRESLEAASSSCPSRSDSLFLSRARARRHMDAYMSHFGAARRSPRSAHHVCLSSRKTTPLAR